MSQPPPIEVHFLTSYNSPMGLGESALPADQITAMHSAIQTAESSQLRKGLAKLQSFARSLKESASTAKSAVDGKRMQALAEILQRPAK